MPIMPYTDKVLEHFRHPHNVGKIENADGKATEGSPACGDMVSVYIKVDKKTQKLSDVKFESYGCASNIATGSIITDLARGKTVAEAKEINWQQASEAPPPDEGAAAKRDARSAPSVQTKSTAPQYSSIRSGTGSGRLKFSARGRPRHDCW